MATPHSDDDPTIYLFTSLTAGSSHIISSTSRLETILKANRIPFKAIDIATDEVARKIWTRKAGKRKLPGLVKEGDILGVCEMWVQVSDSQDFLTVEDWNEYGELKMNLGIEGAPPTQQAVNIPVAGASKQVEKKPGVSGGVPTPFTLAMNQKPAIKPTQESGESTEKTFESKEIIDKAPQKNIESVTKSSEKADKTVDEPAEKVAEKGAAMSTDKAVENTTEPSLEEVSEQSGKDAAEPAGKPISESLKTIDPVKAKLNAEETPTEKPVEAAKHIIEVQSSVTKKTVEDSSSSVDSTKSQTAETTAETHRDSNISVVSPGEIKDQEGKLVIPDESDEKPLYEPKPTQHRGSSVSVASNEEIKKLESQQAIAEAVEEDSDDSSQDETNLTAKTGASGKHKPVATSSKTERASNEEDSDKDDNSSDGKISKSTAAQAEPANT